MSTAQVSHDTSTRHDIRIVMPDDVLGKVEVGDDVYIHLVSRHGKERPIKVPYGVVMDLLEGPRTGY